ncbi:MAG TPA: helix-turn-helix domain-containing protein [Streptomyces sp.]
MRHRRLERCRHDLADPQWDSRPVYALAARWGFTDSAQFSRAFRAAYGVPPSAYRQALRQGHGISNHRHPTEPA